jgi:hypothetical protein
MILPKASWQVPANGDWRAADALMNRIYGKRNETVVNHVPASPANAVIASITLEEKLRLLDSLHRREPAALPRGRTSSADRLDQSPPPQSDFDVRSPRV